MPKIAGFYCEIDNPDGHGLPLVFLHGSGQDETVWGDRAECLGPDSPRIRLRGKVDWEDRYAFFRRRPDRSLDPEDLARSVAELAVFLENLAALLPDRPPVMVGYSNGAIASAALAIKKPEATRGAILMRPLSPAPGTDFAGLGGYRLLLLSATADERRNPADAALLAAQLRAAGAEVEHHDLPCGHGFDEEGRDIDLARQWLDRLDGVKDDRV
ncbi:hypothetical protein J5J10_05375 [Ciceribacter sp. L1K23]|uniref:alpha/beta hydrolase n=1 Tax=Ciceribacter sp. L1K23 TaxID=2820276 RepID=UPI001B840F69|nr:hypothetical protein [Ciceribacter sp. L1K23]MBR0555107.1 hypothetical protein [Ciceribacter sp. L1K23]